MKSTPSTSRRKARPPAKLGDIHAAATSTVSIGTLTWTITESAEASLARVMNLPPGEAAQAAREFVAELGPTKACAQQPGCEIWRASSRWSRLRAVVEHVSETALHLREVLAHSDWQPPGARPAAVVAAPSPAPKAPEPSVLLVRRAAARAAPDDTAVPPAVPAGVSVASALSTRQLLALHEVLADWRRGGVWPSLTKLAAATELPRSQVVALAAELERLNLNQAAVGSPRREAPLLAEVRARVQRAVQQALRPLPATTWRELRLDVDVLAERVFVVTVTAGFDTVDAVIEALGEAKAEGIVRVARGVRAVIWG